MTAVKPEYRYTAYVLRIIDATNLLLMVDLGFGLTYTRPLRLFGVTAPGVSTSSGKNALAWVSQWFDQHGRQVAIETSKPADGDRYGPWLTTVYVGDGEYEKCLNRELLTAGQAIVSPGRDDVSPRR